MDLNDYKNIAIGGVVLLALGYGTGRYVVPGKVVVQRVEVQKVDDKVNKNVVTKEDEIKHTDGSVEIVTTTVDKSTEAIDTTKTDSLTTTTTNGKAKWRVNGLAGFDSGLKPVYGGQVEMRLIGPLVVGVLGTTNSANSTGMVSLGFEF